MSLVEGERHALIRATRDFNRRHRDRCPAAPSARPVRRRPAAVAHSGGAAPTDTACRADNRAAAVLT